MDSALLLRNRSVHRLVVGVPEGDTQVRARIETSSGDVITLQGATLAALCRAYIDVTTHPQRHAVELVSVPLSDTKDGLSPWQLLEAATDEEDLRRELAAPPPEVPEEAPPADPEVAFLDTEPSTSPLGPDGTTSDGPLDVSPHRLASSPGDVTMPVSRSELSAATAGRATPEDEPDDLELDDADDGPVFGDTPTLHSKPRGKRGKAKKKGRAKK